MWRTKELFSDTFYNQLSSFSQSDHLKKKELIFFSKTHQSDIFQGPIFAFNAGAWRQEAETDGGDRKGQVVDGGEMEERTAEEAKSTLFLIHFQS